MLNREKEGIATEAELWERNKIKLIKRLKNMEIELKKERGNRKELEAKQSEWTRAEAERTREEMKRQREDEGEGEKR